MIIFMVMIMFLLEVLLLLWVTKAIIGQWTDWESEHLEEIPLIKEIALIRLQRQRWGLLAWLHPYNYYRFNHLLSKKLYISIRHAFVEPYDKTKRMWDSKGNRRNLAVAVHSETVEVLEGKSEGTLTL